MRALRFDERTSEEKDNFADDLVALTDFFKRRFDLDLYLIYGTLLGAVRENGFIADDKDIDVAYMSKYHDFDDIVKEMVEIYQCFL
jgi:phosphorylcholine metabolism protein LicD